MNYRKIVQENWIFNDIWCYLVIGYFDWNIAVFQQTVVRVYILKCTINYAGKTDEHYNDKEDKNKYLIEQVPVKFNWTFKGGLH